MELSELQDQIKVVAQWRLEARRLAEFKRALVSEWEAQNKDLLANVSVSVERCAEAEGKLREMTLQVYTETGNKTPVPGVSVREMTKLDYDPKEALKWAMSHQIALSLDKKSFEGFAKATPLEFVRVYTEPQATIATNLEVEDAPLP